MKSTALLLFGCSLALTACTKKEPAPATQDITAAPLASRPMRGERGSAGGLAAPEPTADAGTMGSERASAGGLGEAFAATPPGEARGPAAGPSFGCLSSNTPLDEPTRAAIERALADERAAEDRYEAASRSLGHVMPFRQLERAERRHASALEALLVQHRATVPAAPPAIAGPARGGLREACAAGVDAEKKNVALYDQLLTTPNLPEDVRCVFSQLRAASHDRHLPALERCAGERR